MRISQFILYLAFLLLIGSCASPLSATESASGLDDPVVTKTPDPQVEVASTEAPKRIERDLQYIPDGLAYHDLDVYLPATGEGPFPTILAIHGGGFKYRTKDMYRQIANHLTELGYAVVSTNYRLTQKASYPAQVEDVFCALAWVHANNSTYGFDPENIFVMGGSAGGYLAAMVGTVDSPGIFLENCPHSLQDNDWVQGMVIFYGLYDFTSLDGYNVNEIVGSLEPFWGAEYDEIPPETLAEMSPMSWVDGSEPATLLIHGTADESVPSWMSEEFATALADADVKVDLLLLDAEHGFELKPLSSPEMTQSLEAIEAFLTKNTGQ